MVTFATFAKRIFGSSNDRRLKGYTGRVAHINALEDEIAALSDEALKGETPALRARLAGGETLDDLLPRAFAVVREAAKRTLGQRHYDVQLIGGMVLHEGSVAEMKTGEGKTLVATLAVYLNALAGQGVHVVTVNDYLARRDSEWMGAIYRFLGLTVGVILHELSDTQRKAAYGCDITYGTNNELGFDYLRDNMKYAMDEMVQPGGRGGEALHAYAIVDEVDSILIDEARTPLIISGPVDDKADLYNAADAIIPQLTAEDYELDEKMRTVVLTESGNQRSEDLLKAAGTLPEDATLYDIEQVSLVHHLNAALRAHKLFQRDKDYIVNKGGVVIIDEFTGRMMEGRRYSEGLHQALEAKERVEIQPENVTLAQVTFQNYFRLYRKLAGMTGTALTEAAELADIYKLEVVEIPTNRDMSRKDGDDEVYRTATEKYDAIVTLIRECRERNQPVLVGTTSIEKSEKLSDHMRKLNIPHQVLNARYHEQEAAIIAQAGVPGAVTIATNMAGRGTDIQLGGNVDMQVRDWADAELKSGREIAPGAMEAKRAAIIAEIEDKKQAAVAAGGLYVIGTERHESRRIDNQLRGRSGRQGDPGNSKFYLSLDDDLMRIFGSDRMDAMLRRLGLKDGEAIIHPWINKALERAQQKVEARNFDMRKNILKYDDVMNDQRKVVFEQRIELMQDEDVTDTVADMRNQVVGELVTKHIPANAYAEQWDTAGLREELQRVFDAEIPVEEWAAEEGIADEELRERVLAQTDAAYARKVAEIGAPTMRQIEKAVLLQSLDGLWREHLVTLEHLRQVIGLRGYGQRDPLHEYKSESFELFEKTLHRLREDVTGQLMHVSLRDGGPDDFEFDDLPEMEPHHLDPLTGDDSFAAAQTSPARNGAPREAPRRNNGGKAAGGAARRPARAAAVVDPNDASTWGKVSRNAPCPCGSGRKYKHCHGRIAEDATLNA